MTGHGGPGGGGGRGEAGTSSPHRHSLGNNLYLATGDSFSRQRWSDVEAHSLNLQASGDPVLLVSKCLSKPYARQLIHFQKINF